MSAGIVHLSCTAVSQTPANDETTWSGGASVGGQAPAGPDDGPLTARSGNGGRGLTGSGNAGKGGKWHVLSSVSPSIVPCEYDESGTGVTRFRSVEDPIVSEGGEPAYLSERGCTRWLVNEGRRPDAEGLLSRSLPSPVPVVDAGGATKARRWRIVHSWLPSRFSICTGLVVGGCGPAGHALEGGAAASISVARDVRDASSDLGCGRPVLESSRELGAPGAQKWKTCANWWSS